MLFVHSRKRFKKRLRNRKIFTSRRKKELQNSSQNRKPTYPPTGFRRQRTILFYFIFDFPQFFDEKVYRRVRVIAEYRIFLHVSFLHYDGPLLSPLLEENNERVSFIGNRIHILNILRFDITDVEKLERQFFRTENQ